MSSEVSDYYFRDEKISCLLENQSVWYFPAKQTCVFAEIADETNAAKWVKSNVPPKWYKQIKIPGKEGRPALYLTEPGFYYTVCQGKSLKAMDFRDWVFEDLIPKVRHQGLYVVEQNDESMTEYQAREKALLSENERLLADASRLKIERDHFQRMASKQEVKILEQDRQLLTFKKSKALLSWEDFKNALRRRDLAAVQQYLKENNRKPLDRHNSNLVLEGQYMTYLFDETEF